MWNNIKLLTFSVAGWLTAIAAVLAVTGCVHEFPRPSGSVNLELLVHHDIEWTWYDYYYASRAAEGEGEVEARYIFKFFKPGTDDCIATETAYSRDLSRADFTVRLAAPAGESELRVWSDYVEAHTHQPLHHSADDFSAVTLHTPHSGNTDTRDSFEALTHLSIESVAEEGYYAEGRVDLARNTARVIFIATDAVDLAKGERAREAHAPALDADLTSSAVAEALRDFRVRVSYPLYMPSVYNMFLQKPVDSRTGVWFDGPVTLYDNGEARIGMDYVFVNHAEAGVQMMLTLQHPRGDMIQLTDIITVPLLRGRTTVVRGPFLTMQSAGGVAINPAYDGEFNIEFR